MANDTDNAPHPSSQRRRPRRVCLFGLSGDPPTGLAGHMGMVQQLLSHCKKNGEKKNGTTSAATTLDATATAFDEIRVLPVYQHTFQEKRQRLVAFEHRLEMCRLAFAENEAVLGQQARASTSSTIPKLVVSDAEYHSWKRACQHSNTTLTSVGTAALLEYLHETTESSDEVIFSFCLGADSFVSLMQGKWRESERVRELLQGRFVVMNRMVVEEPNDKDEDMKKRHELEQLVLSVPGAVLLPTNPSLGSVSSSQIRTLLAEEATSEAARQQLEDTRLIAPSVLAYIRQHGLYKE